MAGRPARRGRRARRRALPTGGGRPRGGAGRSGRPRPGPARGRRRPRLRAGRPGWSTELVVVGIAVQVHQGGGGGVSQLAQDGLVPALRDVYHALHQFHPHCSSVACIRPPRGRRGPRGPRSEPRGPGNSRSGPRGHVLSGSGRVGTGRAFGDGSARPASEPGRSGAPRSAGGQWADEVTACERRRRRRMRRRSRSEAPPQTPWSM